MKAAILCDDRDIRLSEALKPIGYRMLLAEWPTTVRILAAGAVWSMFSGLNEWRSWVITPIQYDEVSRLGRPFKQAILDLHVADAWRNGLAMIDSMPASGTAVFVLHWVITIVILLGTMLALPMLLRQLGPIGWLITLWLGYMLVAASPTGNSRYLAPILPMLCLTAGLGFARRGS